MCMCHFGKGKKESNDSRILSHLGILRNYRKSIRKSGNLEELSNCTVER